MYARRQILAADSEVGLMRHTGAEPCALFVTRVAGSDYGTGQTGLRRVNPLECELCL